MIIDELLDFRDKQKQVTKNSTYVRASNSHKVFGFNIQSEKVVFYTNNMLSVFSHTYQVKAEQTGTDFRSMLNKVNAVCSVPESNRTAGPLGSL